MATNKASGLQSPSRMRLATVGILAALALAGCGVGVDDPEGQAAANLAGYSSTAQGLTQADSQAPAAPAFALVAQPGAQAGENPDSKGAFDRNPVGLPQDPVPLHGGQGRPVGPGVPPVDGDPRPGK